MDSAIVGILLGRAALTNGLLVGDGVINPKLLTVPTDVVVLGAAVVAIASVEVSSVVAAVIFITSFVINFDVAVHDGSVSAVNFGCLETVLVPVNFESDDVRLSMRKSSENMVVRMNTMVFNSLVII